MCKFLKKLFGRNRETKPVGQGPLKEQPITTPRTEGLDRSTHAAVINEAKTDVYANEQLTPNAEDEITAETFDDKVDAKLEEKPKPEPKSDDNDEPVYDVKKHSKGWQVILPGASRATRVLDTQKEAIDYCRANDYKFNLYKADGTLKQ